MEIFSAVVELISNFWWVLAIAIFGVFALIFFQIYFEKKPKEEKLFKTYPSSEKRILNIDFAGKDVENELDNIEELVEKLKTGKPFIARGIEVIYFADNLEHEVNLSNDGTFVISKLDIKNLIKSIMKDPLDIVRYIQSVEKLIDINNSKNKIELGQALKMMSNAKNFNLLAGNTNIERKVYSYVLFLEFFTLYLF